MKPKILVVAQVYLPGYLAGGPVRSIANIIDWLGDDYDWFVLTTDRDLNSKSAYEGVVVNEWVQVGRAKVFYASPNMCAPWNFLKIIRQINYDLLYLNSFFSPIFSFVPVLGRKVGILSHSSVLIAPRGEFSVGALKIKSFKKQVFLLASKIFGLHNVFWHAATNFEGDDILRVMRTKRDMLFLATAFSGRGSVIDLDLYKAKERFGKKECLRMCFLSRISPMKNIDYALRVLSSVGVPVQFDIYGPKEDLNYWSDCEDLIKKLPKCISVRYMGSVENSQVKSTISEYDVFFLPTRGENYGHVLLEAWSSGLPVLLSDQTPWRDLAEKGVGWDLPLSDLGAFARVIEELFHWSPDHYFSVRNNCLSFAHDHIYDGKILDDNRRMFSGSVGALT